MTMIRAELARKISNAVSPYSPKHLSPAGVRKQLETQPPSVRAALGRSENPERVARQLITADTSSRWSLRPENRAGQVFANASRNREIFEFPRFNFTEEQRRQIADASARIAKDPTAFAEIDLGSTFPLDQCLALHDYLSDSSKRKFSVYYNSATPRIAMTQWVKKGMRTAVGELASAGVQQGMLGSIRVNFKAISHMFHRDGAMVVTLVGGGTEYQNPADNAKYPTASDNPNIKTAGRAKLLMFGNDVIHRATTIDPQNPGRTKRMVLIFSFTSGFASRPK